MDRDLTKTEKFWIKIITKTLFLLTYIQWVWIRAEIGSPEMFVESLKVLLPTFLLSLLGMAGIGPGPRKHKIEILKLNHYPLS